MARGRVFTKGCVFALAVWLLLIGAYAYVALGRIHDLVPALGVGVLGGTFAGMLLSSFVGLFTGNRDRAAIRRAVNMEPMKDGRLEAASGPLHALDKPLEAPFSGQPCVAYEYDVKRPGRGASDYAGYAMAPCAVQTLRGPVRMLGWVMLDQFPAATDQQIDRTRGERYLSSAVLERLGVTSILSVFKDLVADDDGTIRKDYRIDGDGSLDGRLITERALPVGAPVTLLGHWSEARGGFVANGPAVNRLFRGDLGGTKKAVGGDAVSTFGAAVLFFVILHAILVPMYLFAPGGRLAGDADGVAGSVWDERDCDRQKTKLTLRADPNEVGSDAMTPLMNAARMDEPACVSNLIGAGAHLEDRDKFGDTALVHAIRANRDENVKVLLAAGAKDFRITAANGRAIKDGDAPLAAVKDYIDAVYRADFETMARLMAHVSVRRLEDNRGDLPFWQSRLPKTFTVEDGWMTDDAATLTIRGDTKSGPVRIVYQVERQPDMSGGRGITAEADPSVRSGAARADTWQIRHEWRPDER
jgi:hypothetical protein